MRALCRKQLYATFILVHSIDVDADLGHLREFNCCFLLFFCDLDSKIRSKNNKRCNSYDLCSDDPFLSKCIMENVLRFMEARTSKHILRTFDSDSLLG